MQSMRTGAFLALTCASIVLSSCSDPNKNKLYFRPAKGDSRTVVTESKMNMKMNLMGQSMNVTHDQSQRLVFDVEDVSPEGMVTIKATFERGKVATTNSLMSQLGAMTGGMLPVDGGTAEANKLIQKLEGKSFTVKVGRDGKMSEISGLEALSTEMLAGMDTASPAQAQAVGLASGMVDRDTLQLVLQNLFIQAPDLPLKNGDTFTVTGSREVAAMRVPVQYTENYTVTGWDDQKAAMSVTTDTSIAISGADVANAMGMGDSPAGGMLNMSMNLKGTATGTLTADRATGWMTVRDEKMKLTGSMDIAVGGQKMNLPVDTDVNVRVETFSK
ncbi:MAG: hypothetical protein AMXMBFR84_06650 [Candidatus Hydrogenedentota bacterium]